MALVSQTQSDLQKPPEGSPGPRRCAGCCWPLAPGPTAPFWDQLAFGGGPSAAGPLLGAELVDASRGRAPLERAQPGKRGSLLATGRP